MTKEKQQCTQNILNKFPKQLTCCNSIGESRIDVPDDSEDAVELPGEEAEGKSEKCHTGKQF